MNAGDVSRQKDFLYRMLVTKSNTCELDKCVQSIVTNYIEKHSSCHPTLKSLANKIDVKNENIVVVKRALVLFCLFTEQSFVQYLLDREDINNVALSQFVCQNLPRFTKQLLDGTLNMADFVTNATTDYIGG